MSYIESALKQTKDAKSTLVRAIESLKNLDDQLDYAIDTICGCYCKFPDEYRSMYKDVDESQENLMREKCEMCPLNNL